MSDPVVKSAKRLASRPASYSTATKTTNKGSKLAAKSARPKPDLKKKAAAKPPVRKATPAKKASESKSTSKTAPKSSTKSAAKSARPTKAAPAKRPAAKARAATPAPSKKKAAAPAVKSQTRKAAPAAAPKKSGAKQTKPSAPARHAQRHAPAPPRQPTRDEAAALKAFERAHKEFSRGRFAEARSLFRSLIEQHAGVSEVTARARTYLSIAEARLRSESSLPRDAESLYDRGVIELNRGDYVAAQEMFERALKREPDAPDIHYALAATRARLGAIEPALQSLERALELKPALRVRVPHDQDLSLLRNEPEYERLLYPTPRA
jgi:tetratricopeptide (TPR) repeat protein